MAPKISRKCLTEKNSSTVNRHERGENDSQFRIKSQPPNFRKDTEVERVQRPSERCTICLDTLEDQRSKKAMICGHVFHAYCIDSWLESSRTCPICRTAASSVDDTNEPLAQTVHTGGGIWITTLGGVTSITTPGGVTSITTPGGGTLYSMIDGVGTIETWSDGVVNIQSFRDGSRLNITTRGGSMQMPGVARECNIL